MDLEEVLGIDGALAAQIADLAPWLCAHPGTDPKPPPSAAASGGPLLPPPEHPFWLRPDAPRAAVAALEPLRREMNDLRAQLEQAMEASTAALRDGERARQESAQRRAQVAWAGGRISQLEGVLVASKLGIPAPVKPPPPAPAAAPPPAAVAAPKPKGSSAVEGGVMQRLAATEAALEVSSAEVKDLRKQLEAAQRALEAQAQLSSGAARRSRSGGDLVSVGAAAAGGAGLAAELAREKQRADTAERAARAAMDAVRRLTDQLEEKQEELDEALAAAGIDGKKGENAQNDDVPASNGDGGAHAEAVRSAAVALRGALVAERERSKALEAELAAARRAAAAAEERAAAAATSAVSGAMRGSKSGPGALSGEDPSYYDDIPGRAPQELPSPSTARPMEPRGRRGSATARPGDAERRAAAAEEAAEAAAAQATRLRDALAEEKKSADALRAQLIARAGEPVQRSAAAPDDAAARKRAKDAEAALAAERERRAAAEARARAAADEAEQLTAQLAAARSSARSAPPAADAAAEERIAQLERTLHREREAATRALAEARAAAATSSPGTAALPAAMDADDIGPARALMAERQRSAQLAAQLSEVTSRLARSEAAGKGGVPSPAAASPGVAAELARLQARCRSLQEALDNSNARGCELEQELAEARAPRGGKRYPSAAPISPLPSPARSPALSPVPFPDEDA